MSRLEQLKSLRESIYRIARKHKVKKLYVFGSAARQEETSKSDVDFVADFLPGATAFNHIDLEYEMAELLKTSVDVVSSRALRDDTFGREVKKDMVAL
jgi:hypothetical protein